jgi:hypothetical protein
LEANPNKIEWIHLSKNPNALGLIKDNIDKIEWTCLLRNPAIFELDYVTMKNSTAQLHEELMAYVYHPTRVSKWLDKYDHEREYLE